MDIELITLVNSFRNTIALNNLLIKEKITRKLEMIHTMRYYGFPIMNYPPATGKRIIDELRRIDKEGDIMKYYVNVNNFERDYFTKLDELERQNGTLIDKIFELNEKVNFYKNKNTKLRVDNDRLMAMAHLSE